MTGGFSFCGTDIADVGLEYAPENKYTYVYSPAATNIHEEIFDGHNGGYFYGAYKQPKEFVLRCFFEDSHVSLGIMAKAHSLFRIGKSGKLIFKNRPWCYYYTTVTNIETTEMYNYMNGLFVVTMKAYYPYGRSTKEGTQMFYNLSSDEYHDEIIANTAMLDTALIAPALSYGSSESPVTYSVNSDTFLLFNPGTENAKVSFKFSGTAGAGFDIYNKTTDQRCRFIAFTPALADYVLVDGISGKTISEKNGAKKLSFLYHDYGFMDLAPAFPIKRNLAVAYDGTSVTTTAQLYKTAEEKAWYSGKYIYLNGHWRKILRCQDTGTLVLQASAGTGTATADIVLMNELQLTLSQDTSLTKLEFIYKPTFA